MRRPKCAGLAGPAGLFPGRRALIRGNRSSLGPRHRSGQRHLLAGRHRFLSTPATQRLTAKACPLANAPMSAKATFRRKFAAKTSFPTSPAHLAGGPPRPALAQFTNVAQKVLSSGKYDGIIVTQGSPSIEETSYWLSLLMDTPLPICGNSAQRPHGMISNDGPKNIVDSVNTLPLASGRTSTAATRPAWSSSRSNNSLRRGKWRRATPDLAAISSRAAMEASLVHQPQRVG